MLFVVAGCAANEVQAFRSERGPRTTREATARVSALAWKTGVHPQRLWPRTGVERRREGGRVADEVRHRLAHRLAGPLSRPVIRVKQQLRVHGAPRILRRQAALPRHSCATRRRMSSGGDDDDARSETWDDFDADGEEEESQARLSTPAVLQPWWLTLPLGAAGHALPLLKRRPAQPRSRPGAGSRRVRFRLWEAEDCARNRHVCAVS